MRRKIAILFPIGTTRFAAQGHFLIWRATNPKRFRDAIPHIYIHKILVPLETRKHIYIFIWKRQHIYIYIYDLSMWINVCVRAWVSSLVRIGFVRSPFDSKWLTLLGYKNVYDDTLVALALEFQKPFAIDHIYTILCPCRMWWPRKTQRFYGPS